MPEISSREHIKHIFPILEFILKKIKIKDIKAIAYTYGPGLQSSLIIGVSVAKTLSYTLKIPNIPINHIEAHFMICTLKKNIKYPFISIVISGGHSIIFLVKNFNKYKIIGQTLDDSLGEIFDKIAILLDLKYPGGPKIEKLAKNIKKDTIKKIYFPLPICKHFNLNFSFSGLKTYVSRYIKTKYTNCKNKKKKIL